jgi:hypothetical protein
MFDRYVGEFLRTGSRRWRTGVSALRWPYHEATTETLGPWNSSRPLSLRLNGTTAGSQVKLPVAATWSVATATPSKISTW